MTAAIRFQRRLKRLLGGPPYPQPVSQRRERQAQFACPIRQQLCASVVGDELVVPPVPSLFRHGCPPGVPGLVVPRWVGPAVQRMVGGGALSNVREEVHKAPAPAIAHGDPLCAVFLIPRGIRVVTPGDHRLPDTVQRCSAPPVPCVRGLRSLSVEAPARPGVPVPYVRAQDGDLLAAGTAAAEQGLSPVADERLQHGQAVVHGPRDFGDSSVVPLNALGCCHG